LEIVGALVADYLQSAEKPISAELRPHLDNAKQWSGELEMLLPALRAARAGVGKASALYDLGADLKSTFVEFKKNHEFTSPELSMLKALYTYCLTDSETALNYIRKNASVMATPKLAALLSPPVPKADSKSLRRLVKSLVGRDDVYLALQEAQTVRDTNPNAYAQYAELRKAHNAEFKSRLMNYVRSSGEKTVPYADAFRFFQQMGFTHSMVPGFTGRIDDQGRWYTEEGELVAGVPNLATYEKVTMGDGKTDWVCKAVKPDGGTAYVYTVGYKKEASKVKYQNVRNLMAQITGIRKRWLTRVRTFDIEDKESVAAVVLELLYSFAARIGSQPGRGAGTLLVKNVRLTQQGINLAYLGKDSIPTKHVLKETDPVHRFLLRNINLLLVDKGPKDFLFTYLANGKWKRVTPSDVNLAFRKFGASADVSVHKLRTSRGTALFNQLVEADRARRPPKTEKEALERYKKMTEQVGKLLNHKRGVGTDTEKVTGTTAAMSYIGGDEQVELFQTWGFRVPKFLEKLVHAEDLS
jgi:hypothetical protein